MDTLIDTFNTAVTETANEILRKHQPTKKPWVTADILAKCDKRRELKKKKSEAEGLASYTVGDQKLYNINTNLIRTIESLYNKPTSAVNFKGRVGKWFRTTVGVRQGCLLSPSLFIISLERIMTDVLEDHEVTVSIGGRTITNLRFADNIDGLAGKDEEQLAS
ncbi:endonuclease-reverse transcriptase [Plakobranchus ocellatus]|uniref:Endonuclease-reverse transcriptase n=1 Tax=Plakobranchus ocellatus TaxID=259542 RepID=A0AAV3YLK5_9GAST|nr:endonuclease-reverse transcriptase [Plakobranchus ocellatus]